MQDISVAYLYDSATMSLLWLGAVCYNYSMVVHPISFQCVFCLFCTIIACRKDVVAMTEGVMTDQDIFVHSCSSSRMLDSTQFGLVILEKAVELDSLQM